MVRMAMAAIAWPSRPSMPSIVGKVAAAMMVRHHECCQLPIGFWLTSPRQSRANPASASTRQGG